MSPASPLITADELATLYGAATFDDAATFDGVTVLDVRWRLGGPPGIDLYRQGHLPGAVFCDLDADLAAPPGKGGRHPLPEPDDFQDAMRRLGVSGERPVVVYDDTGAMAAARAWWVLRYFGHGNVRVLDGGLAAWTDAGRPVVTGEPAAKPGDFVARPGGMPVLTADQAAELAGSGVLLDARSGERYRGEVEPIDPVAGRVPGALSAPTTENVGPDGRFLPAARLRERFEALGAGGGVATGAYCGSGVTAAHEVLALAVAGLPAALYVGSWSEWITDPSRAVATG
ncbi:sulfurtransferase [Nonomuraea rhizosphaerae]|uniref:sulfurtransferase n=1 Tax=Nonomuraea rhizosphaerae TaxID=2665663 RepID=UPI001C5E2949|nr:sulfurtransferase [Nonomuraea rhizosphaerae]